MSRQDATVMMQLELDHLFVCVEPGGPEASLLDAVGLTQGTGNVHEGQGTQNVRYFFDNAYLELIWVHDPAETQHARTRPTGIWERCRWCETGACPFGVALRPATGSDGPFPFATWTYRPLYLPAGVTIPVAANSDRLNEPLVFVATIGAAPSTYPAARRQPLDHPAGVRRMTSVKLTLPGAEPISSELAKVVELGLVTVERGEAFHMDVVFDEAAQGRAHRFEPELPLSLLF